MLAFMKKYFINDYNSMYGIGRLTFTSRHLLTNSNNKLISIRGQKKNNFFCEWYTYCVVEFTKPGQGPLLLLGLTKSKRHPTQKPLTL